MPTLKPLHFLALAILGAATALAIYHGNFTTPFWSQFSRTQPTSPLLGAPPTATPTLLADTLDRKLTLAPESEWLPTALKACGLTFNRPPSLNESLNGANEIDFASATMIWTEIYDQELVNTGQEIPLHLYIFCEKPSPEFSQFSHDSQVIVQDEIQALAAVTAPQASLISQWEIKPDLAGHTLVLKGTYNDQFSVTFALKTTEELPLSEYPQVAESIKKTLTQIGETTMVSAQRPCTVASLVPLVQAPSSFVLSTGLFDSLDTHGHPNYTEVAFTLYKPTGDSIASTAAGYQEVKKTDAINSTLLKPTLYHSIRNVNCPSMPLSHSASLNWEYGPATVYPEFILSNEEENTFDQHFGYTLHLYQKTSDLTALNQLPAPWTAGDVQALRGTVYILWDGQLVEYQAVTTEVMPR